MTSRRCALRSPRTNRRETASCARPIGETPGAAKDSVSFGVEASGGRDAGVKGAEGADAEGAKGDGARGAKGAAGATGAAGAGLPVSFAATSGQPGSVRTRA